eukprot:719303-Pyramimonas_sp.AAC.1
MGVLRSEAVVWVRDGCTEAVVRVRDGCILAAVRVRDGCILAAVWVRDGCTVASQVTPATASQFEVPIQCVFGCQRSF